MAKSAFNEKDLIALRDEIRSIRGMLDTLKARPIHDLPPEYAVLCRSDLPPDYAVLVRPGNALPPDYAVLVRNPKPSGGELERMPEYAVAVRPGLGALPPEYAVLVRPSRNGPEEVFVVASLAKNATGKPRKKAAKAKKAGPSK